MRPVPERFLSTKPSFALRGTNLRDDNHDGIPDPDPNPPDPPQDGVPGVEPGQPDPNGPAPGAVFKPNAYNGQHVCYDAEGAVYLVMGGRTRWIPDVPAFLGLFGDNWARYELARGLLRSGPQLLPGTRLIQAYGEPGIYLVDLGKKRWIASPNVMDRYRFDWTKVGIVSPQEVEAISDGDPVIEDWN